MKGKLNKEPKSLLTVAQNNGISTYYIQGKLNKNSKCRLWGNWDEAIYNTMSECGKMTEEKQEQGMTG